MLYEKLTEFDKITFDRSVVRQEYLLTYNEMVLSVKNGNFKNHVGYSSIKFAFIT